MRRWGGMRHTLLCAGAVIGLINAGCSVQVSFLKPSETAPEAETQTAARPVAVDSSAGYGTSPYASQNYSASRGPAVLPVANQMSGAPPLPLPNGPTDGQQPLLGDPNAMAPVQLPAGANPNAPHGPIPREKNMTFPPCYIIEPPDVLLVDAVRITPKGPYRVEPLDVLMVQVTPTLENQPILGPFQVGPDGTLSLGYGYGVVRVRGLTLEQTVETIKQTLMRGNKIQNPTVSVSLVSFRGLQNVRGEHLVSMDGTITLGTYGCVNVVGLSITQAKVAIERHLSNFIQDPEVSVRVSAYNSKVYYVITDDAGFGQHVYRVPITGNETVLDAVSAIGGLPVSSSPKKIWLARPTPADASHYIILPVDWAVVTQAGSTKTNYQLFPGDRVFIGADPLIAFDNTLAKVFAPIERILGLTLLGTTTAQSFNNNNNNNGGF
jgi:polysaccharide export outer membrane protein